MINTLEFAPGVNVGQENQNSILRVGRTVLDPDDNEASFHPIRYSAYSMKDWPRSSQPQPSRLTHCPRIPAPMIQG